MRIAMFTETYVPYINGVVTHVKLLKEGLEKLGHQVMIVTADPSTRRHFVKDGVLHCPAHKFNRFYGFGLAAPVSRTRLKYIRDFNPDVLHIHNEFGVGLSGVIASKELNRPLVYTLHTMYDEYIYYIAPKLLVNVTTKISRRYAGFIANKANALTGPSKKCEAYFRTAGIYKHVNVIPNAVELDSFSETVDEEAKIRFREKHNIPFDVMIGCFVGRLGKEKSVDILLDFWSRSLKTEDKIHLLVIGDGPEKEPLEKMAQKLNISDMVTFTGMVEHNDLPPYYASCDVYITASLSDTNSISMLEGMATGLPVLQRYDEMNKDQVRDGINGYVFNSPEEMKKNLMLIRKMSPEELGELKESVIASVKKSGAEDLATYMLSVYQKILRE